MSFIDRFRKNKDEQAENLSFYEDDVPTTNRFASVLFGLFALFVTLLIAAGLFFGGRAVYRALSDDSSETVPVQTQNNDSQSSQGTSTTPAPSSDTGSSQPAPTTQPSTNSGSTAPNNVPSAGDTPPLPRTGDEGL